MRCEAADAGGRAGYRPESMGGEAAVAGGSARNGRHAVILRAVAGSTHADDAAHRHRWHQDGRFIWHDVGVLAT